MNKELEALRAEYDDLPAAAKLMTGKFFKQLLAVLASHHAGIVHAEGMAGRSERD